MSAATRAFRAALPTCTPIITSFLALGISCGLLVTVNGLPFWYAPLMSVVIFGGSLEFVTITMLVGTFAPLETIVIAFMVQARHIFYGIAMLGRYDIRDWKRTYLIYSLCDETFSINRTVDAPEGVDRNWFMFAVSLLNQLSWILGTTIGAVVGMLIPWDLSGLGFVMTALFVVILLENMLKDRRPLSAVIGFASAVVCLVLFGSGSFLLPTLVLMVVLLLVFRGPVQEGFR
ncbi:MAG: AzlC family ABC transporter permease [archaeon]|nr:AzlC family ABC transporter permease [archaeon]